MIRLHHGEEASALLGDPTFRRKWTALYEACSYGTCFQDIPFVTTWYRCYAERFEPLVVTGGVDADSLTGLLFLAISKENGALVLAGTVQAEYQVWLAPDGQTAPFIGSALERLAEEFPKGQLRFLFLPPGTPLDWSARWRERCFWRSVERPLMSTMPENALAELLRKKHYKKQLNQLKRIGDLSFDRIVNPEEFASALDEIIPFFDLRQAGMYGVPPFHSDPLKRPFYLAMMEQPDLLHATVMRLNGRTVAAHIGPRNKQQVVLGILAHSPLFSQYSLGKFQILFLALRMREEGLTDLDLTPGGQYKERFASHHDEAYVLNVIFGLSRALRFRLQRTLARAAKRFVSPDRVKEVLAQVRHKAMLVRPLTLPGKLVRRLKVAVWSTREMRLYSWEPALVPVAPAHVTMRPNCWQDLVLFEPIEAWQPTRQQFLHEALRRIEDGQRLYTVVLDGRLVHYGWLIERQERCILSEVGQTCNLPPNSAVLYDYYTHPYYRGKGLYTESLRQMLAHAAAIPKTERIYIGVLADNGASRSVIEKAGFEYERSFFERKRFGRVTRWSGKSENLSGPTGSVN